MSHEPSLGGPKSVGAYYTPLPVAEALCRWAIRSADDTVLDPAAGDGVFLAAAGRRLAALGGDAARVRGFELRAAAAAGARTRLAALGLEGVRVTQRDFLTLARPRRPRTLVVVGNPPYVRFQRLVGERRAAAEAAAAAAGVALDPLAASWAAFVVHACTFLRPGGRLALVLPSEVGHARYARGVLAFLRFGFARACFVTTRTPLFPQLDQGAVLLLAEGRGLPFEGFSAARLGGVHALDAALEGLELRSLDADALIAGRAYLHRAWLPPQVDALLERLGRTGGASRLGDHARVSTGYVTGANDFFHLSPAAAAARGLGARHLQPALFRGRALRGAVLRERDWRDACAEGTAGYLLRPEGEPGPAEAAYLREGVESGITSRTKVRARAPWYRVGRVAAPDLVLTAMAGKAPRLALNTARLPVCNTLHAVWLHEGAGRAGIGAALALAALSSLAALSAELEGHGLGGGLLKLEPGEAQRWQLPLPPSGARGTRPQDVRAALEEADRLLRAGEPEAARALADRLLLAPLLGDDPDALAGLRDATAELRAQRRRSPGA